MNTSNISRIILKQNVDIAEEVPGETVKKLYTIVKNNTLSADSIIQGKIKPTSPCYERQLQAISAKFPRFSWSTDTEYFWPYLADEVFEEAFGNDYGTQFNSDYGFETKKYGSVKNITGADININNKKLYANKNVKIIDFRPINFYIANRYNGNGSDAIPRAFEWGNLDYHPQANAFTIIPHTDIGGSGYKIKEFYMRWVGATSSSYSHMSWPLHLFFRKKKNIDDYNHCYTLEKMWLSFPAKPNSLSPIWWSMIAPIKANLLYIHFNPNTFDNNPNNVVKTSNAGYKYYKGNGMGNIQQSYLLKQQLKDTIIDSPIVMTISKANGLTTELSDCVWYVPDHLVEAYNSVKTELGVNDYNWPGTFKSINNYAIDHPDNPTWWQYTEPSYYNGTTENKYVSNFVF